MLAIDPNYQANRVETTFQNLKVWKDHSCNLWIYGTYVADDFDLCIGDGACIEVCPVNVFNSQVATAESKALPSKEGDSIYCPGCEAACPKLAIRVNKL